MDSAPPVPCLAPAARARVPWVRVGACGCARWACRVQRAPCVPADVDDCANAPCCQQACTNSPGGYECSCYAGYRLLPDGCGCEGERGWPAPCLWALAGLLLSAWLFGLAQETPERGRRSLSGDRAHAPGRSQPGRPRAGHQRHPEPGGGRTAVAGALPSRRSPWAPGQSGAVGPPECAPRDRPQQPVCLQTWMSARPTAGAAATTAPTWPAPSAAPARPASGWTRTAGAAPVSLPGRRARPFPGQCPPCPLGARHPAGWTATAPPPPGHRPGSVSLRSNLWSALVRRGTSSLGLRTASRGAECRSCPPVHPLGP